MNDTRRASNRILSLIVGVVLLAAGVMSILVAVVPRIRDAWSQSLAGVRSSGADLIASAAPIPGTQSSWWWLVGLAILALVVTVLLIFIFRQGHGHTGRWLRTSSSADGTTIVDAKVAEQLLQDTLDGRHDLVSSHVSTYSVQGTPVLKIAATARRGVSPKEVVNGIERSLDAVGVLFGSSAPACIQVSGGFRARASTPTRLE